MKAIKKFIDKLKKEYPTMFPALQGKKTYIVAAVGVIVNGLIAMGYIPESVLLPINSVLGFLGLGSLRSGISKIGK